WGHACEFVEHVDAALEALRHTPFDLVISDIQMSGLTGLDLLDRMRASASAVPIIFITGFGSVGQAMDATRRGAIDYLTKPCDANELRAAVSRALAAPRTPLPGAPSAAPSADELVGGSHVMRDLRQKIDLVAQVAAPVLLLGESGTGKELVARAI